MLLLYAVYVGKDALGAGAFFDWPESAFGADWPAGAPAGAVGVQAVSASGRPPTPASAPTAERRRNPRRLKLGAGCSSVEPRCASLGFLTSTHHLLVIAIYA